jgi:predicted CopG family antitoxin
MYTMAKTIMVSNEAYGKLKNIKEKEDKSFSEVVIELMEEKNSKKMKNLKEVYGILKGDKEYDKIMKRARKGWERWNKRYA